MDVVFDKLAKLELDDAVEYYELEVPGLGLRFVEEVKRGIRRILEYPNAWALEKEDVRRYVLHKFPYRILYSNEKSYIFIISQLTVSESNFSSYLGGPINRNFSARLYAVP